MLITFFCIHVAQFQKNHWKVLSLGYRSWNFWGSVNSHFSAIRDRYKFKSLFRCTTNNTTFLTVVPTINYCGKVAMTNPVSNCQFKFWRSFEWQSPVQVFSRRIQNICRVGRIRRFLRNSDSFAIFSQFRRFDQNLFKIPQICNKLEKIAFFLWSIPSVLTEKRTFKTS